MAAVVDLWAASSLGIVVALLVGLRRERRRTEWWRQRSREWCDRYYQDVDGVR